MNFICFNWTAIIVLVSIYRTIGPVIYHRLNI